MQLPRILSLALLISPVCGDANNTCPWQCRDSKCEHKINEGLICSEGCRDGLAGKYCREKCPIGCKKCQRFNLECILCEDDVDGKNCSKKDDNSDATTYEDEQSTHEDEQSTHEDEQSTHGNEQSAHGDEQYTHGDEQSAHGDEQSTHGNEQSTHEDEQSAHGDEQYTHGDEQYTHGDEQSTHGDEQYTHGDEQSTYRDDQSMHRGDQIIGKTSEDNETTPPVFSVTGLVIFIVGILAAVIITVIVMIASYKLRKWRKRTKMRPRRNERGIEEVLEHNVRKSDGYAFIEDVNIDRDDPSLERAEKQSVKIDDETEKKDEQYHHIYFQQT